MSSILTVFILLIVTAALFYGGRALSKSTDGSSRLGAALGRHPQVVGGALLLTAALLVALGIAAILMVAVGSS